MNGVKKKSRIKPYQADYERALDLVNKLALQEALGLGNLEVYYLRGELSFQREKVKPVVKPGRLPESKIIIRPRNPNDVEYVFGNCTAEPVNSDIKPQREILDDIASGLGLDKAQALNTTVKARLALHHLKDLPKNVQERKELDGSEYLYHYQTDAGDYTDVVNRSLKLPPWYLMCLRKTIQNELIAWGVVKKGDPILQRIKGVLRTVSVWSDAEKTEELLPAIRDLHIGLTSPFKSQDVGIPMPVLIDKSTLPVSAQLYKLYKRGGFTVVQLPRGSF